MSPCFEVAKGRCAPSSVLYIVQFLAQPQQKAFAEQRILGTAVLVLSLHTWAVMALDIVLDQLEGDMAVVWLLPASPPRTPSEPASRLQHGRQRLGTTVQEEAAAL